MDVSEEATESFQDDLLSLFKNGYNQSSSLSDEDSSDTEILFSQDHPIRKNLPDECFKELMKSPLLRMEREIVENYDIFLNCLFWQVKGTKRRSNIRKAARDINKEFYAYKSIDSPSGGENYGPGIRARDMKNLDTISDHDDVVWNEMEGYLPSHIAKSREEKKPRKGVMPVPKPSSRIKRRNATGPFFPRPKLEEIFENKDFERYYTKGALIAKGAFGKVYLGQSSSDPNLKVAIKSTKLKHEPSRIHNISIEIYLLEKAAHPNVVRHIKSFYWDKQIWSVLEYCPGGAMTSLRKVVLSEVQLLYIMQQILVGLDHMHKNNIAHRDLKCANILLDVSFLNSEPPVLLSADIKLGDFGLAGLVEGPKSQTAMCGSRYWMSPEMIQRVGYDTKTDIYSCGCVMFELMTGKAPYRNQGGLLALFLHATKGCESVPKEVTSLYSSGCVSFFRSMVTHNQDLRPNTTTLLQDPWLDQKSAGGSVLKSALNTAYEIKGHIDPTILRDKYKERGGGAAAVAGGGAAAGGGGLNGNNSNNG